MKIKVYYRCRWCTWLITETHPQEEWERMERKPPSTIEPNCHGMFNRELDKMDMNGHFQLTKGDILEVFVGYLSCHFL